MIFSSKSCANPRPAYLCFLFVLFSKRGPPIYLLPSLFSYKDHDLILVAFFRYQSINTSPKNGEFIVCWYHKDKSTNPDYQHSSIFVQNCNFMINYANHPGLRSGHYLWVRVEKGGRQWEQIGGGGSLLESMNDFLNVLGGQKTKI